LTCGEVKKASVKARKTALEEKLAVLEAASNAPMVSPNDTQAQTPMLSLTPVPESPSNNAGNVEIPEDMTDDKPLHLHLHSLESAQGSDNYSQFLLGAIGFQLHPDPYSHLKPLPNLLSLTTGTVANAEFSLDIGPTHDFPLQTLLNNRSQSPQDIPSEDMVIDGLYSQGNLESLELGINSGAAAGMEPGLGKMEKVVGGGVLPLSVISDDELARVHAMLDCDPTLIMMLLAAENEHKMQPKDDEMYKLIEAHVSQLYPFQPRAGPSPPNPGPSASSGEPDPSLQLASSTLYTFQTDLREVVKLLEGFMWAAGQPANQRTPWQTKALMLAVIRCRTDLATVLDQVTAAQESYSAVFGRAALMKEKGLLQQKIMVVVDKIKELKAYMRSTANLSMEAVWENQQKLVGLSKESVALQEQLDAIEVQVGKAEGDTKTVNRDGGGSGGKKRARVTKSKAKETPKAGADPSNEDSDMEAPKPKKGSRKKTEEGEDEGINFKVKFDKLPEEDQEALEGKREATV
jgi:hypothetical protein